MTPEGRILNSIMEYLAVRGIFAWRNNSGQRGGVKFGHTGSPDIIGTFPKWSRTPGRLLGIEVKAPEGRVSPAQEFFHKELRDSGAFVVVARSVADVETALAGAF